MSDAETLAANREIYNACIKSSKDIHFAVAAADLFIALAFGVSVESAKAAAGYCAFEVAVKAPFGKPLSGVPVTLVKGNPW